MGASDKAYFMSEALKEARKAYAMKETPIGAVVVYDGQIVGRGFNQVELTGDPTQHAEMVAIQEAAKALGRWRLYDCQMYVTMEPCLMCAGAIENSRIKSLYIGASHKKNHLVGKHNDFKLEVYKDRKIDYEFGILEKEASKILTDFFKERREEKSK
nr:nucleoside deaminase [Peptostreptococcus stomatis]